MRSTSILSTILHVVAGRCCNVLKQVELCMAHAFAQKVDWKWAKHLWSLERSRNESKNKLQRRGRGPKVQPGRPTPAGGCRWPDNSPPQAANKQIHCKGERPGGPQMTEAAKMFSGPLAGLCDGLDPLGISVLLLPHRHCHLNFLPLTWMCKMFQQTQHHSYALPVEAVRGQVRIRMKCPKCKKKIMWGVLVFGGRTFLQAAIHRSTPPLDLTHPSITVRIGDVVGTSALPCANIGVCDH